MHGLCSLGTFSSCSRTQRGQWGGGDLEGEVRMAMGGPLGKQRAPFPM